MLVLLSDSSKIKICNLSSEEMDQRRDWDDDRDNMKRRKDRDDETD